MKLAGGCWPEECIKVSQFIIVGEGEGTNHGSCIAAEAGKAF